jgi:TPR repeat protein
MFGVRLSSIQILVYIRLIIGQLAMKKFLGFFAFFLLIFLLTEAIWAADTQKFAITLKSKDLRSALNKAEEEALQKAIITILSYNEQLTFSSYIKDELINKSNFYIEDTNIENQLRENGEIKFDFIITVNMIKLQQSIDNFKKNNAISSQKSSATDNKPLDEQTRIKTHQALNYALVAVSKILYTENRPLITLIYNDIINNINVSEVKDDQELIDLYKNIMDRITEMQIDDDTQKQIAIINNNKQSKALESAFKDKLPVSSGGGGFWGFVGAAATTVLGGLLDYDVNQEEYNLELKQEKWKLNEKAIREVNDLNKQVLETSWRLFNRYQLDGEKRLSNNNMKEFNSSLATSDKALALRRLIRLENEFSLYPPYWFYRGFLHQTQGQKKEALDCFKNFDKIWNPILIKDHMYGEVAKFLLVDSIERANKENQKKYADILIKHSDKDAWLNIAFAGIVYDELGDRAAAEDIFQLNIDNGRGIPVSRLALNNLKQNKKASLGIQEFAELRLKYKESADLNSLMQLADLEDLDSLDNLAQKYYFGIEIQKNTAKAYELAKKLANIGYPGSQWILARLYTEGQEVNTDLAEAVTWFRLAAEQGYAAAQNDLGVMYFKGEGVAKDLAEAVKWYRLAAEQEYAPAQFNLGCIYENGEGVAKDQVEAVKWYRLAVKQGSVEAQFSLGSMYYNGKGVAKDQNEAFYWIRMAAEQGLAEAQTYLGVMYYNGEVVAKNQAEAVKWFRFAADQGNLDAQFYLGICYENGKGVVKDPAEAIKWYRLAADQGHAEAKARLQ